MINKIFKRLKYLLEYVLFLIFKNIIQLFNIDNISNFLSKIFTKIGLYLPFNKRVEENIKYIGANKINIFNKQDKKIFYNKLWDNYGRYLGEIFFTPLLNQNEIIKRVKINGLDKVKPLIQKKQPYILCIAHQANWDFLIGAIRKLYPKFAIIYRKINNPYIDQYILKLRSNDKNIMMIEKDPLAGRKVIQAIKNGYSIAILADHRADTGIKVPFFGKDASTVTSVAKLHLKYKIPIIGAQMIREKACDFSVNIYSQSDFNFQLTDKNDQNIYNITYAINQMIEKWVKQFPHQWFWFHKRWKIKDKK